MIDSKYLMNNSDYPNNKMCLFDFFDKSFIKFTQEWADKYSKR